MREDEKNKRNIIYYNQLVMNERRAKASKKRARTKKKTFSSQEVSIKDFLFIPEQWESFFYILYGIGIPYIVGAVFLFFFVADANYDTFQLLNMNAFLIIWLIGYEIVAAFSLVWILILYLKYDSEDDY